MTEVEVLITIVAGTPQRMTTVEGTMCCKISAQTLSGVGPLCYVGGPLLNKSTKAGMTDELVVGSGGLPGASWNKGEDWGRNLLDASTFYFDGDHSGDQILCTYSQG